MAYIEDSKDIRTFKLYNYGNDINAAIKWLFLLADHMIKDEEGQHTFMKESHLTS